MAITLTMDATLTLLAAALATVSNKCCQSPNSNILEVGASWIMRQHIYHYQQSTPFANVLTHHGDKLYVQSVLYPVRVFTELASPEGLSCGSPH